MFDDEDWDWIVEHRRRRLRPPADRDHGAVPALARLPPPRGLERAALRRGLGRPRSRGSARSCAARSTSTTGPRSSSPSSACASCSKRSAPGSGARRRPRSCCSPATSTTPISARSASAPGRGVESAVYQAVCSPVPQPARRAKERGWCGPASAAPSRRWRARWPASPAHPTPGCAGARSRAPTSTTRSRPCASTAARRRLRLDKTVAGEEDAEAARQERSSGALV